MASCITSQWSNSTSPQIRLTVTGSNASSKVHRLSWKLEYVGHGYAPRTSGGRSYSAVIDGATVASGSYDVNGKTGTYTIASGTKDVSRGSSNRNISFSLSFAFNLTWSGVYSGTRSASGYYTVPSVPYNTYSFNANGGTGAPGSVTKVGGVDFTFPSGKPTRTGYTFNGWYNSSINNGTVYQPGQTVSGLPDQSITWYARWTANTYTVKYNANGGSGAPGQQTKTYGVTLTLSSTKPTRTNYAFKGWGTSAGSTTVAYAAGGSYTANASVTLYAIWELNYTKPKITSVNIGRCTSDGTLDDEGTYAKVGFAWSIDSKATLSSITIGYKLSGSSSYTNVSVTASGKSGTVSKVIGGSFSTESAYDIRITITDNKGSNYADSSVSPMGYIMDFSPEGGVAFGAPAPDTRKVEFCIELAFKKPIKFVESGSELTISKSDLEKFYTGVYPCGTFTGNMNSLTTPGMYYCNFANVQNGPYSSEYGWFLNLRATSASGVQLAFRYSNKGTQEMAMRHFTNSQWYAWSYSDAYNNSQWTNLTLASGYTASEGRTPQYRMSANKVELRGQVAKNDGSAINGTMFSVPSSVRPGENRIFQCADNTYYGCRVAIVTDGTVQARSAVNSTYVSLDGIFYYL